MFLRRGLCSPGGISVPQEGSVFPSRGVSLPRSLCPHSGAEHPCERCLCSRWPLALEVFQAAGGFGAGSHQSPLCFAGLREVQEGLGVHRAQSCCLLFLVVDGCHTAEYPFIRVKLVHEICLPHLNSVKNLQTSQFWFSC